MNATEYQTYLKSIHWKQFRKTALRERGSCCEECGISNPWAVTSYGQPLNVHHLSYEHLGKERPQDVIVLCRRCHEAKHGTPHAPDMGDIFWRVVKAVKQTPEAVWEIFDVIENIGDERRSQLTLAFGGSS